MNKDLSRLCELLDNERGFDSERGKAAGIEWATQRATPSLLRSLRPLEFRRVSSGNFLFRAMLNRFVTTGEQPPQSFDEVFGGHLVDGTYYSPSFLEGFVSGALSVWRRALDEKRSVDEMRSMQPVKANKSRNQYPEPTSQIEAPWKGWYRDGRDRPWMIIAEGATELEVIEKMIHAPAAGDKMALPQGQRPDDFSFKKDA